jgi:hypothetical protein
MIPQPVSIITGLSIGDDIQWGGGQDSFYEVMISFPSLHLTSSVLFPSNPISLSSSYSASHPLSLFRSLPPWLYFSFMVESPYGRKSLYSLCLYADLMIVSYQSLHSMAKFKNGTLSRQMDPSRRINHLKSLISIHRDTHESLLYLSLHIHTSKEK